MNTKGHKWHRMPGARLCRRCDILLGPDAPEYQDSGVCENCANALGWLNPSWPGAVNQSGVIICSRCPYPILEPEYAFRDLDGLHHVVCPPVPCPADVAVSDRSLNGMSGTCEVCGGICHKSSTRCWEHRQGRKSRYTSLSR